MTCKSIDFILSIIYWI